MAIDVFEAEHGFAAGGEVGGVFTSKGLDAGESVVAALISVVQSESEKCRRRATVRRRPGLSRTDPGTAAPHAVTLFDLHPVNAPVQPHPNPEASRL